MQGVFAPTCLLMAFDCVTSDCYGLAAVAFVMTIGLYRKDLAGLQDLSVGPAAPSR